VRCLCVLTILIIFAPAPHASSQDLLSGELSLTEGGALLQLECSPQKRVTFGSCLSVPVQGDSPEIREIQLETEELSAFIGSGELGNGWSLKKKPYSRIFTETSSTWSANEGTTGNSLLFGFKSQGVSFVAAGEEGKPEKNSLEPAIDSALGLSPRFAGLEYERGSDFFFGSCSGYIARLPGNPSGDGWRPGGSAEIEESVFGCSSALKIPLGPLRCGAWVAGSAGFCEIPGWACSTEVEAKWGATGNPKVAADSSIDMNIFSYAAISSYRTALGEIPLYDFLTDMTVSIRFHALILSARAAAYSLSQTQDSGEAARLLDVGAGTLKKMFWNWRNDLVKAGLDITLSGDSLAARMSADGSGAKTGVLTLRHEAVLKRSFLASLAFSARVSFARNGVSETVDSDTEETFDQEDESTLEPGEGTIEPRLRFSSFAAGCRITWKGKAKAGWLGNGSISLGLSGKKDGKFFDFRASAEISQAFAIGQRMAAFFTVSSPEGGYSLGKLSTLLPSLTIGWTVRKTGIIP